MCYDKNRKEIMAGESKLQSEIAKFCRERGARVIKQDPTIGKQKGLSDLLVLKDGWWGMIEVKDHKNSEHQPGQDEWIAWADENSYGRFVYHENWAEIQAELEEILR